MAKMVGDVEAHALYERNAALVRATGSRRLPKLRASPSSPAGWALATQQSMPLHQLMSSHSTAAVAAETTSVQYSSNAEAVKAKRNVTNSANVQKNASTASETAKQLKLTPLGREAQMLNAAYQPALCDVGTQAAQPNMTAKKGAVSLDEAVVFEERYHRAGREVLGQRIDALAVRAAAREHSRQQAKAKMQLLGFKPLKTPVENQLATTVAGGTAAVDAGLHHKPAPAI